MTTKARWACLILLPLAALAVIATQVIVAAHT